MANAVLQDGVSAAGVTEEVLGMLVSGWALQAGLTKSPGWNGVGWHGSRTRVLQLRTQSGTSGGHTVLVCERQGGDSSRRGAPKRALKAGLAEAGPSPRTQGSEGV